MKYGEEAVYAVLEIMNRNKIPYMLVGSYSSNAYGEARATKDADFVINLDSATRKEFISSLPSDFVIDQQMSFEMVGGTTRQILSIPSIPFEIELFDLSDDAFDLSRFQRKVSTIMGEHQVWLPTPEDVILQKLRWVTAGRREKDFLDCQGILKVRSERLDWDHLSCWAEKLQLNDLLEDLKNSII